MVGAHLQIWPWVKISIKYIVILNFTKFQMNPAHMDLSGDLWKKGIKKYGVHPPFHGIHPPVHGIHPPFHGFHLKKVWSPSPIPWENYGVHPPLHGFHLEFLESTPHSMDSIWIIPGRVKYSYTTAFVVSQTPPWVAEFGGVHRNGIGGCRTWVGRSLYTEFHFHNIWK